MTTKKQLLQTKNHKKEKKEPNVEILSDEEFEPGQAIGCCDITKTEKCKILEIDDSVNILKYYIYTYILL